MNFDSNNTLVNTKFLYEIFDSENNEKISNVNNNNNTNNTFIKHYDEEKRDLEKTNPIKKNSQNAESFKIYINNKNNYYNSESIGNCNKYRKEIINSNSTQDYLDQRPLIVTNNNSNQNNLTTAPTITIGNPSINNNNSIINNKKQHPSLIELNSDKVKFFTTLKSLFAIFDPNCTGSIDISELETLGTDKNEILFEVLDYLRASDDEKTNRNLNSNAHLANSSSLLSAHKYNRNSRSSSTNSRAIQRNNNINERNEKNQAYATLLSSPTIFEKNKRVKQSKNSNESNLVTFDEFINAAELVLIKRKNLQLLKMDHMRQDPSMQLRNSYNKISNGSNVNSSSQDSVYLNQTYFSNGTGHKQDAQPKTKHRNNFVQLPINSMCTSTTSSVSSSSTSSSMSPSSSSTSKQTATTLSQAFEQPSSYQSRKSTNANQFSSLTTSNSNESVLNSFDLNGLIEKECQLLQQGLSHIELVKQWYVSQLHENTMKKTNTKKLKYQNLFGIDKMLTELKQTNEMNLMFVDFLAKNKLENNVVSAEMNTFEPIEPASSNEKETIEEQQKLPSYDDYVEKFDLNKQDAELENYLREKQMRIENLQKEKSSLIRRLFEMKSESANLACTILKLEENTLNNKSSSEQTKLKPLDNNIKIVDSNVQDLNQINKFTNQPKANLIVNFNSLYPNSYENELKLNSNENENFAVKSNKPQFFQTINNNNQRQKSYF